MKPPQKDGFAEPLQQVDRTLVLWRGRKLVYFGGCDYHRLSSHPAVLEAMRDGLAEYGLNVAASRKTTGNHLLFEKLEQTAARFFGAERAVLVSSGYLTNLVVAQALRGTLSQALLDERAHSSLQDAVEILGCRVTRFKHRDYAFAAKKLGALKDKRKVALLTDGLFAHDGSLAPIREYRQALGGDVLLWIDDSHAAGVLGKQGRGSIEQAGIARHNVIQTVTFSKAFGVYGGAVLSDSARAEAVIERARAVTGNTPLPLPLAAAVLEAMTLLKRDRTFLQRLRANIATFWETLGAEQPPSPIVSFVPAAPERMRKELLKERIYPSLIRYPGGPPEGYFRFAISSEHTPEQVKALARVIASAEILV